MAIAGKNPATSIFDLKVDSIYELFVDLGNVHVTNFSMNTNVVNMILSSMPAQTNPVRKVLDEERPQKRLKTMHEDVSRIQSAYSRMQQEMDILKRDQDTLLNALRKARQTDLG